MQANFSITGHFRYFYRLFPLFFAGHSQNYRSFSILLQVIFFIFLGCFQYFRLFQYFYRLCSMFLLVISIVFTGYVQFFCRLFSIILQVIFKITVSFWYLIFLQVFVSFSQVILNFFTGFFDTFRGYFHNYRFFSFFLQVILNITGYFHYFYRLFSIQIALEKNKVVILNNATILT